MKKGRALGVIRSATPLEDVGPRTLYKYNFQPGRARRNTQFMASHGANPFREVLKHRT